MSEEKRFTLEELAQYDGKNGNRAYIAFQGKVYDVTDNVYWEGGDHMGAHIPGHDLTPEMADAPHGPENLEKAKFVGVLAP